MSVTVKAVLGYPLLAVLMGWPAPTPHYWQPLLNLRFSFAYLMGWPAGTLDYWQGRTYLAVVSGGSLLILLYLVKNDPALLRRRLRSGPFFEQRISQKIISFFITTGWGGLLVVSIRDFREGWSHPPPIVEIIGNIAVAAGLFIIFLVLRENSFAAAAIQVEPGQKVIMTGPYSVVRHPMYTGLLIMFMGTPPALGSYWGLLVSLTLVPCFAWRLIDEETFLTNKLPGYAEYREKVSARLIPGVF